MKKCHWNGAKLLIGKCHWNGAYRGNWKGAEEVSLEWCFRGNVIGMVLMGRGIVIPPGRRSCHQFHYRASECSNWMEPFPSVHFRSSRR